jgi:dTDP-4-dehydrorhamnose 3,5-epimerase
MIFTPTPLDGAYVVELECKTDARGFFARAYCEREFADAGLIASMVQCNLAFNALRGTVRGMHWRSKDFPEAKVVRAIRGAIWDVIIDLRPESKTFLQSFGIELTAENRRALYVPPRFAHGFQTLMECSEVFYQMSEFYDPSFDCGMRWNDPLISIDWPLPIASIHDRDASYQDLNLRDLE